MADEFNLDTRFSSSRGLFPYIAGILGLAVVVIIVMVVTGIGVEHLPYSEYFAVRAPTAPDGSEALSLLSVSQKEENNTVTINGTVMNRTESPISGLQAVITIMDRFTLPVQTVNAPVDPVELGPKAMGTFQTTVMLGEHGIGTYTLDFRLPNDGPFVPHKDERPVEPVRIQEKTR